MTTTTVTPTTNNTENRRQKPQNPPPHVQKGSAFLLPPPNGASSSMPWNYWLHTMELTVCRRLSTRNRLASCLFAAHIPKNPFCKGFLLTLLTLYLHRTTS